MRRITEDGPVDQSGMIVPLAWERPWVQIPPGPLFTEPSPLWLLAFLEELGSVEVADVFEARFNELAPVVNAPSNF